jgi:hypothetical protein
MRWEEEGKEEVESMGEGRGGEGGEGEVEGAGSCQAEFLKDIN